VIRAIQMRRRRWLNESQGFLALQDYSLATWDLVRYLPVRTANPFAIRNVWVKSWLGRELDLGRVIVVAFEKKEMRLILREDGWKGFSWFRVFLREPTVGYGAE